MGTLNEGTEWGHLGGGGGGGPKGEHPDRDDGPAGASGLGVLRTQIRGELGQFCGGSPCLMASRSVHGLWDRSSEGGGGGRGDSGHSVEDSLHLIRGIHPWRVEPMFCGAECRRRRRGVRPGGSMCVKRLNADRGIEWGTGCGGHWMGHWMGH